MSETQENGLVLTRRGFVGAVGLAAGIAGLGACGLPSLHALAVDFDDSDEADDEQMVYWPEPIEIIVAAGVVALGALLLLLLGIRYLPLAPKAGTQQEKSQPSGDGAPVSPLPEAPLLD